MKRAVIAYPIASLNKDKHFYVFEENIPEEVFNYFKTVEEYSALNTSIKNDSHTGYIYQLTQKESLDFLSMVGYEVRFVGFNTTHENIDIWWPDGGKADFEYIWSLV